MALCDYPEYDDFSKRKSSYNKLALKTWQLVPTELHAHVEPLFNKTVVKMILKSMVIQRLFHIIKAKEINAKLPLDSPMRLRCPPPFQPQTYSPSGNISKALGVSDDELYLEFRSVVEQKAAELGESCVNSIGDLLNGFLDVCTTLKDLEARLKDFGAPAEGQEEEWEAEKCVRAELEKLELVSGPESENLESISESEKTLNKILESI